MTAGPQVPQREVPAPSGEAVPGDAATRGATPLRHACDPAASGDVPGTPAITGRQADGRPRGRLVGIDAARGVALVGMMAVHNYTATDEDGELSLAWSVAAGKSAALFALLAGVGIAFASGGRRRPTGRRWTAEAASLLVRALVIGAVGLLLGHLVPADLASVILPYYAVLFLLAVPLLSLSTRTLVGLAVTVAVAMPLLSHVLRAGTELVDPVPNPTLGALVDDPLHVLRELTLTGVYPALPWMAYLCAGLAVGRALLTSRRTVLIIMLVGVGLAVAARTTSWLLLDVFGGRARLESVALQSMSQEEFAGFLREGASGVTPPDTPWWLATTLPHSSTPLDLAYTIGVGLVVVAVCILVGRATTALLRPLAAAGSMTLTLYSLHLLLLSSPGLPGGGRGFLLQSAVVVTFALVWSHHHGRGPLEEFVARLSSAARRAVENGRRPSGARALPPA
ncbi:heparan-alpha-glucosaminide N-acetyltransferase domain-containing protein [Geodermatophilus sp. SYSU D00779]